MSKLLQLQEDFQVLTGNLQEQLEAGEISMEDYADLMTDATDEFNILKEADSYGYDITSEHAVEQFLTDVAELEDEGEQFYDEDEDEEFSNQGNLASFSSEQLTFADILADQIEEAYGDNVETGLVEVSQLLQVNPNDVVDWYNGQSTPDFVETDALAEILQLDEEDYFNLQQLTADERGEDLEEILDFIDEGSDEEEEYIDNELETANYAAAEAVETAEFALAQQYQRDLEEEVSEKLEDIVNYANELVEDNYMSTRELDVIFGEFCHMKKNDRLTSFNQFCEQNDFSLEAGLSHLALTLTSKEEAGQIITPIRYSDETVTESNFSAPENEEDASLAAFAAQFQGFNPVMRDLR